MPEVKSFRDVVHSRPFPLVLMILNVLGAFGCGTYSLYLFITHRYSSVGTFVALMYLLGFSIIIPSAELGLMAHPYLMRFSRFLVSPVGRAFLYIFMGGVILGNGVGGWVVGIYLLALGVLNIGAMCVLKD